MRAVMAAVAELSAGACAELVRRMGDRLILLGQNHRFDLHPLAHGDSRFIGAVRAVAELLGHAPTTTEYRTEQARRLQVGDDGLPSLSAVLRRFGSWPAALAAAGLGGSIPPSGIERRRRYQRRVVHRYTDERLVQCLRACEGAIGRIPMVRDYAVWREDVVSGHSGSRPVVADVPHYRTIYERFGDWSAALAAAGMDGRRACRTSTTTYRTVS
jgi:hypothetical protein